MEHKKTAKIIVAVLGGVLTVILTILAAVPLLNQVLTVEVAVYNPPATTEAPRPEAPEEVPVTVYYVMPDNSKKISAIYVEVFQVTGNTVYYMEVPVDTKANLSEELYKSLQTYAPELPQYLKLSNMAESFSVEYGLTGCNRILSEQLGISLKEYVRTDAKAMEEWLNLQAEEKTDKVFLEEYTAWLQNSTSSRITEERWMYYESRQQITAVVTETAPGSQEKDGYLLSGKRCKERLEECILRSEVVEEKEE